MVGEDLNHGGKWVKLVDFESAREGVDVAEGELKMARLLGKLGDESGRGGGIVVSEEDE